MQRLLMAVGLLTLVGSPAFAHSHSGWEPPWPESGGGPRLGVMISEPSFKELDSLGLSYGVRIREVRPGSRAQAAGLRRNDILLDLDGQALFSVARLQWLVARIAPGESAELAYYRNGETRKAEIHMEQVGQTTPPRPRVRGGWVGHTRSYLGVGLQPLTEGLREAFGVSGDAGMLVAEVAEGSPAAKAGLRAGDVIVKLDRRIVHDMGDVCRVLDYLEPGQKMAVDLVRDKETEHLSATLGERKSSGAYGQPQPYTDEPPFFVEPDWWRDMGDFMQRWREYWQDHPRWTPRRPLSN